MISKEEVQGLSALARLKLTDAEVAGLQKDISAILDYVGQISDVNTSGKAEPVLPELHNVLREDVVRVEDDPLAGKEEAIRKEFPKREGDYLVVQKILQKDE